MHIPLSSFQKTLAFGAVFLFSLLFAPRVHAATLTVCASGCDYTSIGAAFSSALNPNDTIDVQAGYASSSDSYPLVFPASVSPLTLDCQNSGAVIGNTGVGQGVVQLNASSAIQNCSFSNVSLLSFLGGHSTATVSHNTFATTTTSTIDFVGPGTDFNIDQNTGLNSLQITGNSTGTITGNSIYNHSLGAVGYAIFLGAGGTVNAIIANNDITLASIDPAFFLAYVDAKDVTFHANTIRYLTSPDITHYTQFAVYEAEHLNFTNNYYQMPSNANGMKAFEYWWHGTTTYAFVDHNTFVMPATCFKCFFMYLEAYPGATTSYVTTTNNIFYSASSTGNGRGIEHSVSINDSTSTLNLYNDYNNFWQLAPGQNLVTHNGSTLTLGPNTKYVDPGLKTTDADAANDFELAPYSLLLDVNGSEDIGAYSAARGAVFHIDAAGPINYSTIDAATTVPIETHTRSGDTWILAPGSYDGFRLTTSTDFTENVTITGSGAATIVNGSTNENAIFFDGVSSSTIDNLVVQNASTTSVAYTMTRPIGVYNGITYNDASLIGGDTDAAVIVGTSLCNIDQVVSDGADVTSFVGLATSSWNLAMAHTGSAHVSVIVPNNFINSAAAFDAACTGFGLTVDRWIASAFTVNNGSFTYNAAAMAAAGVTIAPGFINPSHLDKVTVGYAGLKLNNTNNILITNVTSTQNGFGVWLDGSATDTAIHHSALSQNTILDIQDRSSGDTIVNNVFLDLNSLRVENIGKIYLKNDARVYITSQDTTPLAGIALMLIPESSALSSSSLVTAVNGYTPFTNMFNMVITSSSQAVTNGGYNPYTIVTSSTVSYMSSSTLQIFTTPYQTAHLVMQPVLSAPLAPSSLGFVTLTTSTTRLKWNDNSNTETGFILQYVTGSDPGIFPGTSLFLPADTTSTMVTGLNPNTRYIFRIAALNGGGISTYVTSSVLTTYAVAPSVPLIITNPQKTSLQLTLSQSFPAANPSQTLYAVVNYTSFKYLKTDGTLSTNPVWATPAIWGQSLVESGLLCNTAYSHFIVAKNSNNIATSLSPAAVATTNSCQ